MTAQAPARRRQWLMLLIVLLAFGLRLCGLGAQSLWYDETVSAHLASKTVPDLVAHTAGDIHPPGYYLLLHAWTRLAGGSDWALAFPSLFFGVLLVALAYWLGARVYGPTAGLLAAFLVAISPYNLWYSQEVRMYTLGAALGMGLLAAVLHLLPGGRRGFQGGGSWRWLALYALLAALGLWTLYYFAFLLVALNLMVLAWWLVSGRQRAGWSWLGRWALAQVVVLVLYAPWIPAAWRQATNPPVPPWRGFTGLGQVLVEVWSALCLGQSVDPARVWPVLLLFAVLFALGLLHRHRARRGPQADAGTGGEARNRMPPYLPALEGATRPPAREEGGRGLPWLLAGYVFIPVLLVYAASFITPLYHVRYAFTYSTPFYAIVGGGLAVLARPVPTGLLRGRGRPLLAGLGLATIVVASGLSIAAYHSQPRYASDDHRAAVRYLADHWRSGDAVLVNAGYVYPALLNYWDDAPAPGHEPIAWQGRLLDYPGGGAGGGPVVLQTGTVDGEPSLGWGDPESDFYAMDRAETADALQRVFADFDRVWVYRIYDTVTDEDGSIRAWLDERGTSFEDQVFTGEGQLRLQGYLTGRDPLAGSPRDEALADGSLRLVSVASLPATAEAGGALDLVLVWQVGNPPSGGAEGSGILFAGLFDAEGERWAQADEQPLGSLYPVPAWPQDALVRTPLRVPVSPGTPPGSYQVEVGWYRFEDGQPVWQPWAPGEGLASGERLVLAPVQVVAPKDWAALPLPEVSYGAGVTMGDGLRLLGFDAPRLEALPGESVRLDLYWLALHDAPQQGAAVLQLAGDDGRLLAEAAAAPAGGRAPFAGLAAGQVVRDPRTFALPGDLAPGVYNLNLGRRQANGTWLPVRRGPVSLGQTYPLATVRALGRQVDRTPPQVEHPAGAEFRMATDLAAVRLVGYDLHPPASGVAPRTPGLQLTLYWQVLAPLDGSYKLFVHLVGEGGPADIRAQTDAYPHLPTTVWLPGEYLRDEVTLNLPGDLAPGSYRLLLGLYDEATGRRPATYGLDGEVLGDSLLLEEILIGE